MDLGCSSKDRLSPAIADDDDDDDKQKRSRVLDKDFRLAVEKSLTGIATIPDNWNDLTVREQRDWLYKEYRRYYGSNMPESLTFLWVGSTINGDCELDEGPASGPLPDWLDREKFRRGQRFAMNNCGGISLAEMLSLYMLFSFEHSLKPLIVTGKSSDPFTSFKRYLSTSKRVINWYSSDVWTTGTEAHKDIQAVRKMHANIRKKLRDSSYSEIDEAAKIENMWSNCRAIIRDDFRDSCPAPEPRQCPYMFGKEDQFRRPKGLNQCEMSGTQFGFMGLVVLYPQSFGIHGASDQDLDDFCHLWRGLGYLLGIEDEFNFCKGTLEEVKGRSRDFIEYWVKSNLRDITPEWEHMMRCVMEGISYYLPGLTYERSLLYLADIIGISMPRLRASLSYTSWVRLHLIKFTFNWIARFPAVREAMNRRTLRGMDRALEYNDEKLASLQKRSDITLARQGTVILQTSAMVEKESSTKAIRATWCNSSAFFVFLSTFLLLNLPIIMRNYVRKLIHIDNDTALES